MKSGPKPVEPRTSESIERATVRLQRMPYNGATFGAWLAAIFGDNQRGRGLSRSLCQLLAICAIESLEEPAEEVLDAMLGRSSVPNKVLARSLFRSGVQAALGHFLEDVRPVPPQFQARSAPGRTVNSTAVSGAHEP
jgi:hypothetical protein